MQEYKQNHIREPEIHTMGVQYSHGIVNILLLNTKIGTEVNVVEKITELLDQHSNKLKSIHCSFKQQSSIKFPCNEKNNHTDIQYPLDFPLYAFSQTIGNYSLSTFFSSKGFALSEEIGVIDDVLNQHYIIGAVPTPEPKYQYHFHHLDQSFNNIFTESVDKPLISVCQFQTNGIMNTSCAGVLILPIMKAIDDKISRLIQRSVDGSKIAVTLIDTFNWSDTCIIIRSNSYNIIAEFIDEVRSLTFNDIFQAFESFTNINSDKIINVGKHSFVRLSRILKSLADKQNQSKVILTTSANELDNHIFTKSISTLGFSWRYAEQFYQSSNKLQSDDAIVDIIGNVFMKTKLNVRPGHDRMICDKLDELKKDPKFTHLLHFENRSFLFGDSSILLSWYNNTDIEIRQPIHIKDCIDCLFLLRTALQNIYHKGRKLNSLLEMVSEVEIVLNDKDKDKEFDIFPLNLLYSQAVNGNPLFNFHKILNRLKSKQISRYLRRSLINRLSFWIENLVDHTLSAQMIEMVDIYIPWIRILSSMLSEKSTTINSLENHIKFFIIPFGQSISQRFLESSKMIYSSDLSMEFKGGYSKILTGLDGLAKCCMSLIADTNCVGAISIIGINSAAQVKIIKYPDSSTNEELNLAVTTINRDHMVHPFKITTFLHEILHVVIQSKDYVSATKICNDGNTLFDQIFQIKSDTISGFNANRIKEIATEYLLALLIFYDNPDLYSRVYLSKTIVDPDLYGNLPDENSYLKVLIEHTLKCFCIYSMLKINRKIEDQCKLEQIDLIEFAGMFTEYIDGWWEDNCKFVVEQKEKVNDFLTGMKGIFISEFINNKNILISLKTIICATNNYFLLNKASDKALSTTLCSENFKLRQIFLTELLQCIDLKLSDIISQISDNNCCHTNVIHFYFTAGDPAGSTRSFRIRRLESFIGYILIIRAFHEIIDSWVQESGCDHFITQRDYNGDLLLNHNYCGISLDRTWGTIFVLNHDYLDKYTNLRIAIIKSMWHLGEVTKHSDMMNLLQTDFNSIFKI